MKTTTWMAIALVGLTVPAAAQGVVTSVTPANTPEKQATMAARAPSN